MRYFNTIHSSRKRKILSILIAVFLLASYSLVVFAVAPSGGYQPGDTLDPDCAPNDTDCLVTVGGYTFDSPLVNTAGVVSIPAASGSVDGYLSASDWNAFNAKESGLGTGTSMQYLRGDKTFATLNTSVVPEGSNLYWTNNRFDTRIANVTSLPSLQTIGTITSGVWHGAQITDAYISDSITASNYIPLSQKGTPNGVATLDGGGKITASQLSSFSLSDTFVVNSEAEMLNLTTAELGDVAIRLDVNKSYILTTNDPSNLNNWQEIITPLNHVIAVNGQTGAVNLTTTDINEGLNLYYTDSRVDDYLNTQKGVANGIASLDANGHIPTSQIGSIVLNETYVVPNQTAMLAISGAHNGDLAVITSTNETYVLADENNSNSISSWIQIVNGVPVSSVNGQTGVVNLTTTNISEGSNQYFTNTRARNALTATGPLTYNAATGVFGITASSASTNGYLSAVDWSTFNSKQNALTFGNVTSSNPEITITGGTGAIIGGGLDISIPDASDTVRGLVTTGAQNFAGVKTFVDNVGIGDISPSTLFSVGTGGLFQVDANGNLVKINNVSYDWPAAPGGTDTVLVNNGSGGLTWSSNGLVSLNGSTDATQTFATSMSGSDFSITSSGGIHTFNFPTASASARGLLSSAAYTEFNNKPFVDTSLNNITTLALSSGGQLAASGGFNNIVFGYQAGDAMTTGNNNTLLGYQAGKNITSGVAYSFFAGYQAGLSASTATNSNFIGRQAGANANGASYANFFGRLAGQNASGAQYGVFIGDSAGSGATGASNATFIGQSSGLSATGATYSNFIGTSAGFQASGATTANFIGYGAGYIAINAQFSNFIGRLAGNAASSAAYSNFIGFQAGNNAVNATNSIFIGKNAGNGDLVNNTASGSSIAIGDGAGTGGNSNSIALGASAINTLPNQFLIGSSYTNFNVRGVNYVWPAAQATGSGQALVNNGSGTLSWASVASVGGISGQLQYNNSGALAGVTGVTYDGTNFDASDSVFRMVDNGDSTKRAIFEVSGIDTGTTRTYTFPNAAGTIALTSDLSGYLKNSIGISGGTTLVGGTASGENLTLQSTSNATKGKILFGTSAYDEVNNRLGIGTSSPTTLLDVRGNATFGTVGVPSLVTIIGDASNTALRIGNSNSAFYYDIYREGLTTGLLTFQGNQSGATGYLFKNEAASGKYFTFSSAGRFGINVLSPTASLQLPAGTATASTAPLKFTSGTNLTTPEAGVMEYDGTSLFFTRSGTLRAGLLMTDTASPFNTYSQSAKGATAFTSGTDNFLGGQLAGGALTAGSQNVLIGTQAGNLTNVGLLNSVMIGYFAGQSASGITTGSVFVGSQAGQSGAGSYNSNFIGQLAGYNASSAYHSNLFGYQAGYGISANNVNFFGQNAGYGATLANDTVGIGQNAGRNATGSIESIYLGKNTGYNSTGSGITGDYNIIVGSESGRNLTSGGKNILIGYNLNAQSAATDGQMTIGNLLFGTGIDGTGTTVSTGKIGIGTASPSYRFSVSDTTTAGIVGSFTNSDGTCTLDPGDVSGWSCPSDLNLKKDITTLEAGSLGQILALRPVTYRLINEDSSANLSTGLIAQEVQTMFPKLVKTQIDGTLALNYGGLTPYMISAIQEMNLKIVNINNMDTPNTWRDALIGWFANMTNGINDLYAKVFHADRVETQQLCVGQTCLDETQVQQILQVIGSQGTPPPIQNNPPAPDPGDGSGGDPGTSGDGTGTGDTGSDPGSSNTPDTGGDTGSIPSDPGTGTGGGDTSSDGDTGGTSAPSE